MPPGGPPHMQDEVVVRAPGGKLQGWIVEVRPAGTKHEPEQGRVFHGKDHITYTGGNQLRARVLSGLASEVRLPLHESLKTICRQSREQALHILEVMRWRGMTDAGPLGNTPQGKGLNALVRQFVLRRIQQGGGKITVVVMTRFFHTRDLDTVQMALQNLDTVYMEINSMNPETLFQTASQLALLGWLALFVSPLTPRFASAWAGLITPLILSVGYSSLILAHWTSASGGFGSLLVLAQLMENPWVLLAGWVHYLAFDLLIGTWEVRVAREEGIPHLLLLPCLVLTFLLGPAGFLTFQALRAARQGRTWRAWLTLPAMRQDSPRYTTLVVFLAISILPVCGAFWLDERLFQGINVWIKPLKFLFAILVYLLTLAWFARFAAAATRTSRRWILHERAIVCAIVAELLWIGGAAAWGTASHYNLTNPLMTAIYGFMGAAAILLTSASSTLALAIHRNTASGLSPLLKAGLVWGLGLTLPLTLLTAGTMSALSNHWVGGSGTDAGGLLLMGWSREGGDLRVSHFFATHAMHVLPAAAWVWAQVAGGRQQWPAVVMALLYTAFILWTFVQALAGQPFL
jgi:hypothetical protein